MIVTAIKIKRLVPPKDSLREAMLHADMSLTAGDIVAISSKVVSIDEGRCIPTSEISKDTLIEQEADWYVRKAASKYRRIFTIAKGALVGSAGIDESNGNGHYILYPKDPMHSAYELRTWIQETYCVSVGVVITDSISTPLRRGAVGFALGWAGFEALQDYRGEKDIFDRPFEYEVANRADAVASAAVLAMGEGSEQTPIAILRDVPNIVMTDVPQTLETLAVQPEEDLFASLFFSPEWKEGGN